MAFSVKLPSRQLFQSIMNHTDTVIFTVDRDRKLLAFNGAAESFFLRAFDLLLPVDQDGEPGQLQEIPLVLDRFISRALMGEEIKLEQDFSLDGEIKRYKALYSPLSDGMGGVMGCNLFLRDITNWWEKQKQEEARYRDIFESVYDGIIMLDAGFNISQGNQAAYDLFGVPPGTPLNIQEVIHPEDKQKAGAYLEQLVGQGFYSGYEGRILNKAGETKYVEVNSVAIFDENGEFQGSRDIVRDITAKKLTELELEQKNRNLEKANQELDNFVYRAAHDMRAPIASVLGLMDLMEKMDEVDEIREMLGLGRKSLQKLESFIRDIVDYSRNKRTEVEPERIDLETLVMDCVSQLQHMQGADKIDIEVNVRGDEPFFSDPKRIVIVLNNLLSNAIRYADHKKSNPRISVSATHSPTSTQITVSDNGLGIPKDHLAKIFRMFYRAHNHSKGTGIGLYITQETVEKLGGKISVDSVEGEGSSFRMEFPNTLSS